MMTMYEHLKAVRSVYEKIASDTCKKYGVSFKELDILMYLVDHPDKATATDIVKRENMSKSQVSMSLKVLESKGYVIGEHIGSNRRTIYLRVTEMADEIIDEARNSRKMFAESLTSGFSEDEIRVLVSLLSRVKENVFRNLKKSN